MDSDKVQKKYSRETILKIAGGMAAAVLGFLLLGKRKLIDGFFIPSKRKRLAMLMDLDKCIGCNACTVACKAENGVALGGFRTRVLEKEIGEYPKVGRFFLPVMCNHCVDAPCVDACPNKAIVKRNDGLVDILKDKCQGLQLCVSACPYGAIYINPDENPSADVEGFPSRFVGKADKCNFCMHRIDAGLEPACSNTCPTDARIFGDLSDPASKIANLVKEGNLSGLLEEEGTKPQVFYKGGRKDIFEVKKKINDFKS